MKKEEIKKTIYITIALILLSIFLYKIKQNEKIIYEEENILENIILLKQEKNYNIYTNILNIEFIDKKKEKHNLLISLNNNKINIEDIIKLTNKEIKYDSNKIYIKYLFNKNIVKETFNIIKCANSNIYLLDTKNEIKNICEN